jgi:hypothetical protein
LPVVETPDAVDDGAVTGWEERGPAWRGFATGGAKVLFRFGSTSAGRICFTEAAIEDQRPDSLYLSTGGGWASATVAAIRALCAPIGCTTYRRDRQQPAGRGLCRAPSGDRHTGILRL